MNCIVASGPVIIENNKVLLNRHGDNLEDQKWWKFVGGKVEDDEISSTDSLENACKREVMEEMGIEIENLIPIKPMLIPHPNKPGLYVILIHYLAKRIGEVKPSSEIVDYKWFDIHDLPKDCAPNIKPVIEEYIKISKNSDY